jgi:Domain of Unknown Function (DUF1080)
VNIFDERPDPSYGTGAIVNVPKPSTFLEAANQWNTYEITAKGPQFTITLNGVRTVDSAQDSRNPAAPSRSNMAASSSSARSRSSRSERHKQTHAVIAGFVPATSLMGAGTPQDGPTAAGDSTLHGVVFHKMKTAPSRPRPVA